MLPPHLLTRLFRNKRQKAGRAAQVLRRRRGPELGPAYRSRAGREACGAGARRCRREVGRARGCQLRVDDVVLGRGLGPLAMASCHVLAAGAPAPASLAACGSLFGLHGFVVCFLLALPVAVDISGASIQWGGRPGWIPNVSN